MDRKAAGLVWVVVLPSLCGEFACGSLAKYLESTLPHSLAMIRKNSVRVWALKGYFSLCGRPSPF